MAKLKPNEFYVFDFDPLWKNAGCQKIEIIGSDFKIENLSLVCSNLMIKSNGVYYINNRKIEKVEANLEEEHALEESDFTKTNIQKIIHCGIYDILIYDEYVFIANNTIPYNESNHLVLEKDILELLKTQ